MENRKNLDMVDIDDDWEEMADSEMVIYDELEKLREKDDAWKEREDRINDLVEKVRAIQEELQNA